MREQSSGRGDGERTTAAAMHGTGGPDDQMDGRDLLLDEHDEGRLPVHAAQAGMAGAVDVVDFHDGVAMARQRRRREDEIDGDSKVEMLGSLRRSALWLVGRLEAAEATGFGDGRWRQ